VVLGEVIGKEAGLIERFHQLQPVFVEAMQRRAGKVLDMVEDAEPDAAHFRIALSTQPRQLVPLVAGGTLCGWT
jgi:hypothetical protein